MKLAIGSAALPLIALVSTLFGLQTSGGDPVSPCSICAAYQHPDHASSQLDDGLSFATSTLVSKPLIDPETDKSIHVFSFHFEISGPKATAFKMDAMEYVNPETATPFEYDFGGILPEMGVGTSAKGVAAHSYHLRVAPKNGKMWASVTGNGDIDFLPIRTK